MGKKLYMVIEKQKQSNFGVGVSVYMRKTPTVSEFNPLDKESIFSTQSQSSSVQSLPSTH